MHSAPAQSGENFVPRQAHAMLVHAVIEFLAQRGLTDPVRMRVPEQTARTLDNPPWADRWVGSQSVEDVLDAIHGLGGASLVEELGRFAAQRLSEGRVRPVIAGIFSVLGKSPDSLFKSLDVCGSLAMRGVSFSYRVSPTSRSVVAWLRGGNVSEASRHALRGALQHAFDLAGVQGEVGAPEVLPDGAQGARIGYAVRF
jgi:hypothetical protein